MNRRTNRILIYILLMAAVARFYTAWTVCDQYIETEEFIPCAESISWDYLPIRDYQHPALPSYFIRASHAIFGSLSFGNELFAYRVMSVLAGLASIYFIYLTATLWWGSTAGLIAAFLLAANRYHIFISAHAIDLPFDMFFSSIAIWAFSLFLWKETQEKPKLEAEGQALNENRMRSAKWLFFAGISCGLAFLCKEFAALMLPIFFLSVCFVPRLRTWLRRWELYAAAGIFLLVISPDLIVNLTKPIDPDLQPCYTSYTEHFSRIARFEFNVQPILFYFGDIFTYLDIPHVMKSPNSTKAVRIVATRPFLFKLAERIGHRQRSPVVGDIQEAAALGAGDEYLADVVSGSTVRVYASLIDGVRGGNGSAP